jgi:long-subunit fatty acid transport protein
MFPDGATSRSDMPAMLAIGASYPLTNKLNASLSLNYYFDKNADYGKKDTLGKHVENASVIDKNFVEYALGLEYNVTDKFLVSAGFLRAVTGVSPSYQNDLSYSNTSNTVGGGLQYKITPCVALNLGALYTMYEGNSKTFNHKLGTAFIPVTEDYNKTTWMLAAGVDIKIGK